MKYRMALAMIIILLLLIQVTPYTIVAAESSAPFEEILKLSLWDPDEVRYWSSILFTRHENGGQQPYLAITGETLREFSIVSIYNLSNGEFIKDLYGIYGYKLFEVSDKDLLVIGSTEVNLIIKNTLHRNEVTYDNNQVYYYKDGDIIYVVSIDESEYYSGDSHITIRIMKYVYNSVWDYKLYRIPLDTVENICGELGSYYYVKPTAFDGSRIIITMRLIDANGSAVFMVFNTRDGSLSLEKCITHDFGSVGENYFATLLFSSTTRHPAYWSFSDGVYPYIAGFDGSDELYVYKYGWDDLKIIKDPGFKKDNLYSNVKIVIDSQGKYHIAVLDKDGDTPRLIFLDPEDLSVEKIVTLDGYIASYPVMAKGYYYGAPALYVAAVGYVVVVSVDKMEPVYSLKVEDVSEIYQIDYTTSTAGDTLLVRGQLSDPDRVAVIVYSHIGLKRGTLLRLDVDKETAYVGESIRAAVTLTSMAGTPLEGRVVYIEKLDHGVWSPIATAVTGEDGKATIDIGAISRGEMILRARYPGSQDDAPSWSRSVTVSIYERASTEIRVHDTWVETIPLPVEVTVRSLDTGAPLGGIWVTLYSNISGGHVAIASGQTGADGKAILNVRLPVGIYSLKAIVADARITTEAAGMASVRITPPLQPVGEGPYIAPIGRVIAYGTALTEPGRETGIIFAFYYGEGLVEPDKVWVEAIPDIGVTLSNVGKGIYVAKLTPPSTGTYTIILHVSYAGSHYIGAGYVYSINISSKVDEWGMEIEATLAGLKSLDQALIDYLDEINSSLGRLNITRLVGVMEDVQNKTILLVNITQETSNNLAALLSKADKIKTIVTSNGDTIIAMIGDVRDMLTGINASIQGVANGFVLINTSIGLVAASLASLQATLDSVTGDIYTIKTSIGEVTINLEDLAETIDNGSKNITQLMKQTREITGLILDIQDGVASILDNTGNIKTILLDDLKPRVIAVGDKLALVDTQLGLMATKTGNILSKIEKLENTTQDTSQAITELSKKIDNLSAKIDTIKENTGNLKTEDMIARGLGGIAVLLGVIAVALSAKKR